MLDDLTIVLVRPKFPENIGSVARACANMGCPNLTLVAPQQWDPDRASALATPQGMDILRRMRVESSLPEALKDHTSVYAATARTGGWRKGIISPARAAELVRGQLEEGRRPAVVLGPEDHGLSNEDVEIAGQLITIPTSPDASSLNLAHAALILLYECHKACAGKPFVPAGPPEARPATHDEQETMFRTIQEALLAIDFLKKDNPDYWMLPFRRFIQRIGLKRNEFNLLMGVCRQVLWMSGRKER